MKLLPTTYRIAALFCWLLVILLFGPARAQTLRAIVVADYDDTLLRRACLKDVEMMAQNFRQISQGIHYPLQQIDLNREQFTGAAIRAMLDTLTVQPGDVLFFYYTGHGYNTEASTSPYPFLKLKDWQQNPLSLDEVSNRLQQKKARLSIVMGDCCNGIMPLARGLPMAVVSKGTGVDQDNLSRVLQKLFVESCGTVKVTSAQRKQLANADPVNGSLYTQAFENAFENMLDKNAPELITWETLLNDTRLRLGALIKSAATPADQPADQQPLSDVTAKACTTPEPVTPVTPPVTPPAPAPDNCLTFDKVNELVNELIDNSKSREARQATLQQTLKLFTESAYVRIYVNDTPTPPNQSVKGWLTKLYLNAGRGILRVNFIEKSSTRTTDCQRFENIAVQEFWKQ